MVKSDVLSARTLIAAAQRAFCGRVIRQYATSVDGLGALRVRPADLLITGLNLRDYDGLDLIHAVWEEGLVRRLLVVTDRRDERVVQFLVSGGLDVSFVDWQGMRFEQLTDALTRLQKGDGVSDLSLRAEWSRLRADPMAFGWVLTDAEMAVLAGVAAMGAIEPVARWRGTSPATVHTQRKRIMQKLRLRTQAELVTYAACRGLVRFDSGRVMRPGFEWEELVAAVDGATAAGRAAAGKPYPVEG